MALEASLRPMNVWTRYWGWAARRSKPVRAMVTVALGVVGLWTLTVLLTGVSIDRGALILIAASYLIGVPLWMYLERFDEQGR